MVQLAVDLHAVCNLLTIYDNWPPPAPLPPSPPPLWPDTIWPEYMLLFIMPHYSHKYATFDILAFVTLHLKGGRSKTNCSTFINVQHALAFQNWITAWVSLDYHRHEHKFWAYCCVVKTISHNLNIKVLYILMMCCHCIIKNNHDAWTSTARVPYLIADTNTSFLWITEATDTHG